MMLRKGCCVAIWLGQFSDELEADEYLFSEFGSDFQCCPDESNVPEFTVLPASISIDELLKPFSSSANFANAASILALEKGIVVATTAVIFYQTFFDDEASSTRTAKLTFLGNFEW